MTFAIPSSNLRFPFPVLLQAWSHHCVVLWWGSPVIPVQLLPSRVSPSGQALFGLPVFLTCPHKLHNVSSLLYHSVQGLLPVPRRKLLSQTCHYDGGSLEKEAPIGSLLCQKHQQQRGKGFPKLRPGVLSQIRPFLAPEDPNYPISHFFWDFSTSES